MKHLFPEWRRRTASQRAALVGGAVAFLLVLGVLLFQNFRSAFRFYPSGLPGYTVQAFDATPRWAGTRALFFQGLSPYSAEANRIIQTQYFGRPLEPDDDKYIRDQQKGGLWIGSVYTMWFNWIAIVGEGLGSVTPGQLSNILRLVPGRYALLPLWAMILGAATFWVQFQREQIISVKVVEASK